MDYDTTIAEKDHMVTAALPAYFATSDSAAEAIRRGLKAAGKAPAHITAAMDFGSGYGRVYRTYPVLFPNARLVAVDLMEDAVRFCAETFSGTGIQSNERFEVELDAPVDFTWLGSVFTHLPEAKWQALFDLLGRLTMPGGIVIFSYHGERALVQFENGALKRNPYLIDAEDWQRIKADVAESGLEFVANKGGNYKHQRKMGMDVTEGEYGFDFNTKEWVERFIDAHDAFERVAIMEAAWGNNHDVAVMRRL